MSGHERIDMWDQWRSPFGWNQRHVQNYHLMDVDKPVPRPFFCWTSKIFFAFRKAFQESFSTIIFFLESKLKSFVSTLSARSHPPLRSSASTQTLP